MHGNKLDSKSDGSSPLVRNRFLRGFILVRDFLFKNYTQPLPFDSTNTKSVLFCLGGHLGDALNAIYVIRAFREIYPEVKINLLAARWMRPVLGECSGLWDKVIWIDFWASDRSSKPLVVKIARNAFDFIGAFIRLSELKPDVAFDLYYYWPNSALLLRLLNNPMSIGFTAGGGAMLYQYPIPWKNRPISVVKYMEELVRYAGFSIEVSRRPLWRREDFSGTWFGLLKKWKELGQQYILIHPGTGAREREWPKENWKRLISYPILSRFPLVLAGSGRRESFLCAELSQCHENVLNLCGKLNFHDYLVVVANAAHVIGLESLCGHLAAGSGVPCTLIHPGITIKEHWQPWALGADVIRYEISCSPCQRSGGCEGMKCMRCIGSEDVVARLQINPAFINL